MNLGIYLAHDVIVTTTGMTYAPSYVLLTPVIIHYVGLEDLSVTFGATMMSGGIGLLVAPPLGGQL